MSDIAAMSAHLRDLGMCGAAAPDEAFLCVRPATEEHDHEWDAPDTSRLWQHRCSDGVGGCTAISVEYLGMLLHLLNEVRHHLASAAIHGNYRNWQRQTDLLVHQLDNVRKVLYDATE